MDGNPNPSQPPAPRRPRQDPGAGRRGPAEDPAHQLKVLESAPEIEIFGTP
jgi:hypothetical protein